MQVNGHSSFQFVVGRIYLTHFKTMYTALYSMTLRTVPEKMRLSASVGGSVCNVMNLLVFIFFPARFSCSMVSKMLDLQYLWKSEKIG